MVLRKCVAIVDYGMGNLRSVSQALKVAARDTGWEVRVTSKPEEVLHAQRVVLPGQGAMPDCMKELRDSGLLQAVFDASRTKPMIGVCIGMQMLLDHSAEGDVAGLKLIPGEVVRFAVTDHRHSDGSRLKVPQIGWNRVWQVRDHAMWHGIPDGTYYYFVHSYFARPSDVRHTVGSADYGQRFAAAIAKDNIFATQFHPEKSADCGLALYRNFLNWRP